ncbi:hypothetical protein RCL1_003120 [Eukaryota sp. TZLM3-RCL]
MTFLVESSTTCCRDHFPQFCRFLTKRVVPHLCDFFTSNTEFLKNTDSSSSSLETHLLELFHSFHSILAGVSVSLQPLNSYFEVDNFLQLENNFTYAPDQFSLESLGFKEFVLYKLDVIWDQVYLNSFVSELIVSRLDFSKKPYIPRKFLIFFQYLNLISKFKPNISVFYSELISSRYSSFCESRIALLSPFDSLLFSVKISSKISLKYSFLLKFLESDRKLHEQILHSCDLVDEILVKIFDSVLELMFGLCCANFHSHYSKYCSILKLVLNIMSHDLVHQVLSTFFSENFNFRHLLAFFFLSKSINLSNDHFFTNTFSFIQPQSFLDLFSIIDQMILTVSNQFFDDFISFCSLLEPFLSKFSLDSFSLFNQRFLLTRFLTATLLPLKKESPQSTTFDDVMSRDLSLLSIFGDSQSRKVFQELQLSLVRNNTFSLVLFSRYNFPFINRKEFDFLLPLDVANHCRENFFNNSCKIYDFSGLFCFASLTFLNCNSEFFLTSVQVKILEFVHNFFGTLSLIENHFLKIIDEFTFERHFNALLKPFPLLILRNDYYSINSDFLSSSLPPHVSFINTSLFFEADPSKKSPIKSRVEHSREDIKMRFIIEAQLTLIMKQHKRLALPQIKKFLSHKITAVVTNEMVSSNLESLEDKGIVSKVKNRKGTYVYNP